MSLVEKYLGFTIFMGLDLLYHASFSKGILYFLGKDNTLYGLDLLQPNIYETKFSSLKEIKNTIKIFRKKTIIEDVLYI